MQTKRLAARLSALLPDIKAEGNHDLAARIERVIADLEGADRRGDAGLARPQEGRRP